MTLKLSVADLARTTPSALGQNEIYKTNSRFSLVTNPDLSEVTWFKIWEESLVTTGDERATSIASLIYSARTPSQIEAIGRSTLDSFAIWLAAHDGRYNNLSPEAKKILLEMCKKNGISKFDGSDYSHPGPVTNAKTSLFVRSVLTPELDKLGQLGWMAFIEMLPEWESDKLDLLAVVERLGR